MRFSKNKNAQHVGPGKIETKGMAQIPGPYLWVFDAMFIFSVAHATDVVKSICEKGEAIYVRN